MAKNPKTKIFRKRIAKRKKFFFGFFASSSIVEKVSEIVEMISDFVEKVPHFVQKNLSFSTSCGKVFFWFSTLSKSFPLSADSFSLFEVIFPQKKSKCGKVIFGKTAERNNKNRFLKSFPLFHTPLLLLLLEDITYLKKKNRKMWKRKFCGNSQEKFSQEIFKEKFLGLKKKVFSDFHILHNVHCAKLPSPKWRASQSLDFLGF